MTYIRVINGTIGLLMVFMFGCGPKVITTKIHEDSSLKIHLKQIKEGEDGLLDMEFQHPLDLPESQAAAVLRSIQIQYKNKPLAKWLKLDRPEKEPAFSDSEIEQMAEPLSIAFNRATPSDRIHFELVHRQFVFRGGTTTGIIFAKDDHIHFILGNYKYLPRPKRTEIYRGVEDRIHSGTPDVNRPLNTKDMQSVVLAPGEFQALQETETENLQNRWLRIDYRKLLQSIGDPSRGMPQKPSATLEPEQIPSDPESAAPLEDRLRVLKKWREEGLITEEEYTEKKEELLKEF